MYFGLSIYEVGLSISWRESCTLALSLLRDPETLFYASHQELSQPITRDTMYLVPLVNNTTISIMDPKKAKSWKGIPTPWKKLKAANDKGKGLAALPIEELRKILRPEKKKTEVAPDAEENKG